MLEAEVVAPGIVRVVPGTAPITSQARGARQFAAGRLIMASKWLALLACGIAVSGCGTLQRLSEVGRAPEMSKSTIRRRIPAIGR